MPVVADDNTVFVSTVQVGARGLKLTKNGPAYDVSEAWSTRKIQLYHINSVQIGDYVYASTGFQGRCMLAAINIKTGAEYAEKNEAKPEKNLFFFLCAPCDLCGAIFLPGV